MLEKEIEKILREEVRSAGGKAYKWVSPGNTGVPDRIVIFKDTPPIFVELKTKNGKLTAVQRVQIETLKALGQKTYVLKGKKGLCDFFREFGYNEVAERLKQRFGV